MDDLISRQAAIEHLKKRLYETALNNCTEHPYYEEIADNRVDTWLNELPDAQPEIISCKECDFGVPCGNMIMCELLDYIEFDKNYFCGYAERRQDAK